jgi:hypothetical protein
MRRILDRWPRLPRIAMAVLVCGMCTLFALEILRIWGIPDEDLLDPYTDAYTYLAAGERLNAGHPLYELQPGDRPVLILPTFTAPLLSPPPIAAIWRPLAAVPFGLALWVAGCWIALLATVAYLVLKIGLPAAVLAAALSWPIGEQMAAANMAAFFPAIFVLLWRYRDHPRTGLVIGGLAALKLAPGALGGWSVGQHGWRAIPWLVAGGLVLALIGLVGAGWSSYVAYFDVARDTLPSDLSLAGRTGLPWLPYAVLVAGTLLAAALGRWPRLSYAVAFVTMIAGTPAIYVSTMAIFLGILAPLVPDRDPAPVVASAADPLTLNAADQR